MTGCMAVVAHKAKIGNGKLVARARDTSLSGLIEDLLREQGQPERHQEFVFVPRTSTEAARQALRLPVADLEGAFQAVAAMQFGAERIVTRNVQDYRRSPIPAITTKEFLKELE